MKPILVNNNSYYKYDIAKMNPALSTALQSWSRRKLLIIVSFLIAAHIAVFFMGVIVAPSMFHDANVPGTVCVKQDPPESNSGSSTLTTWYQEQASETTRCLPMETSNPKVDSLSESLLAFRFPTDETTPSSYTRWNWRLLGSLYLSLSFNEDEDLDYSDKNVTSAGYALNQRNIPVTMEAKLDASYDQSYVDQTTDEHHRLFEWVRLSEIKADRKLQCTVTSLQPGLSSVVDYSCTLTPLFSIEMLSNQSYILQLNFSPPRPQNGSDASDMDTFGITESSVVIKQAFLTLIVEDRGFHTAMFYLKCFCVPFILGALVIFGIRLYLNDLYVSIPDRLLVTCALAQILHDIPVEALIADGNIWEASPYLKLMDELGRFLLITCLFLFWIIYTKDKISTKEPWERNTRYYWRQIVIVILGGLIAMMWAVYGRGPGLSNAFKNHWLVDSPTVLVSLGLIFSLAALALAYQTYLSVLIFRALCDISVVHYRQHYCAATGRSFVPHRIWRIKMVLLYSFAVSVLTIAGLILHLAMELSLHWNPQFYLNPIPFHLTFASAYILGMNGLWNLHIITLLLMLARSTSGSSFGAQIDDYVRPVTYTCRSLDEVHLQHSGNINSSGGGVILSQDDCCVLDSLNSNHFSSGEESNMKMRRQSSEDFLEMQAARYSHAAATAAQGHPSIRTQCNRGQYCRHRYEDFSSSPDYEDYEDEYDEHEAMVDEVEDPLEMARQGTVHLWENEGSNNVAICQSNISDAFLRPGTSSVSPVMVAAGTSDDTVLYRD